jgi:sialic acid synthase SpsE
MGSLEVIAEAAQGYAGRAETQRFLASAARAAGADSIKFQLVFADELATSGYEYYETFSQSEMPDETWRELASFCHELGIRLYLDVFGERSLTLACEAGCDGLKLHSSDTLNIALIDAVAAAPVSRVLLSTGGSYQSEIRAAVASLTGKDLVLVHGFQGYPTPDDENHVDRVTWLRENFPDHEVGFADHVVFDDPKRTWLAAVAIGCGATVVEKHLTTALALRETDFQAALAPDEFAEFVANMRTAETAMGSPTETDRDDFAMGESESRYRAGLKKQVVARRDLRAGETISAADIVLKRTPTSEDVLYDTRQVVGQTLGADVSADQPITATALA